MFLPRICIPTSDAIGGSIGEGVDEILNMRSGKRSDLQSLYIRLIGDLVPVAQLKDLKKCAADLVCPFTNSSDSGPDLWCAQKVAC